MKAPDPEELRLVSACVDLIGHTGATSFQMRYDDDQEPTVWIAVVRYPGDDAGWEVAAADDPMQAVLRLTESLVDGGTCTHCRRMTAVEPNWANPLGAMLKADARAEVCLYLYDPELGRFERSCRNDPTDNAEEQTR